MKNKLSFAVLTAFTGTLLALSPTASQAQDSASERLLPHRAVYALSMSQERADGIFSGASGGFEYEWADVCDGWAIRHEAEILFSMAEGAGVQMGWKVSTWEDKEGKSFRYNVRRFQGGQQTESVRGDATSELGVGGVANFSQPARTQIDLPDDVYFPTAHSLEMMGRLKAPGDSFFASLFDGSSEEEGLTDISAIAQRAVMELPEDMPADLPHRELFEGKTGLSVAIAYYLPSEPGAEPISEQQVVYYDNGIVTEVIFDFGDVVLEGVLVDLELLEDPGC